MMESGPPPKQGLYDPALEHDSCGFGFVADIKGRASHDIIAKALEVLLNLEHRRDRARFAAPHPAGVHRVADGRPGGVRAQALRDPAADRKEGLAQQHPWPRAFLRAESVVEDDRL